MQIQEVEKSKTLLQQAEANAASLKEQLEDACAKVSSLGTERENLHSSLREKSEHLRTALEAQQSASNAVARMQMEIQSLTVSQERYAAQLEYGKKQVHELHAQVASYEKDKQSVSEALRAADANFQDQLRVQNVSKDAEITRLRNEVKDLEAQVAEVNELLLDIKTEEASKSTEYENAKEELLALRQANERLSAAERKLSHELSVAQGSLRAADATIGARTTELHAAAGRIESMSKQLAQYAKDMSEQQVRVDKLERTKLTTAQVQKMMAVKEEHAKLKVENKQLATERAELKAQLASVSALSSSGSEETREMALQLRKLQAESAAAAIGAATMRTKLEGELDDTKANLEDADGED
jgi:chromosome segregation ATPase